MKKTLIMTAVVTASTFCLPAKATDNVVVKTGTGSSKIALTDIKALKFNDDKLLVYTQSSETPAEFDLADIVSLKFIDDSTDGIDAVTPGNQKFSIRISNGVLSATGVDKAKAAIYSINGQRMLGIASWNGSAVSLANLANGVYVLTINNQKFKFVKK